MNFLKIAFTYLLLIILISNIYATTCPQISYPGQEVGRITDPRIDEGSGLVASRKFQGIFYFSLINALDILGYSLGYIFFFIFRCLLDFK